MAATDWTAIGSLATAILAFLALITAATTWGMARATAQDQRMALAFELLTGHTQRRSAGIAILAGGLPKRWRRSALQLAASQAVYLLMKSDSGARPDEVSNLEGLVALLVENHVGSAEDDNAQAKLCQALSHRLHNTPESDEISSPPHGLHVPRSALVDWADQLGCASSPA